MVTVCKLLHPLNALFPIVVTDDGSVNIVDEFPMTSITAAVDSCCYNTQDFGDVYYELPSALIRDFQKENLIKLPLYPRLLLCNTPVLRRLRVRSFSLTL